MLAACRSPDPATRLVALSAVSGFRTPEVLAVLRDAVGDPDESVRSAALGFLAAMPGAVTTGVLTDLLRSSGNDEDIVSALSVHVEGRITGLLAALETADDEVAAAVIAALSRLQRPDATAALMGAMASPNVAARKAAASALAVLASKEALTTLRHAAADDPAPEVREICAVLLAR